MWYKPIGIIAIAWTIFVIILFVFPSGAHPTAETMSEHLSVGFMSLRLPSPSDYTIVVIMTVFLFASLSWTLSARKWFKGPVRTIKEDQAPEMFEEKAEARVEERNVSE